MNVEREIIAIRRAFCIHHRYTGDDCINCPFNYGSNGVVRDCNKNIIDMYIENPSILYEVIIRNGVGFKNISIKVE